MSMRKEQKMKPLDILLDFLLHALRADPQLGTRLLDLVKDWSKTAKVPTSDLLKLDETITAQVKTVDQKVDAVIDAQFKGSNNS